ncbi:MAG: DUF58 domain-containing protein [Victivallales bacterium]|nr:DUF58 domain-containing protein [Victivallales bacterium]
MAVSVRQQKEISELARLIALQARREAAGALSGLYRSRFLGRGLDFSELTDYDAGQDARSIHWPTSLRKGRMLAKRFEEERQRPFFVAMDASRSMRSLAQSWETSVQAAALLLACALHNGDCAGMLLCAENWEQYSPPGKGTFQLERLVLQMFSANPPKPGTALAAMLSRADTLAPREACIVVISDFLTEGYEEPLRHLARRQDVLLCHIQHAMALPSGTFTWEDAETGEMCCANAMDLTQNSSRPVGTEGLACVLLRGGEPAAPALLRHFQTANRRRK